MNTSANNAYRPGARAQVTEGPLRGVIGKIDDIRAAELALLIEVLPPRLERAYVPGDRVWPLIVHTRLMGE